MKPNNGIPTPSPLILVVDDEEVVLDCTCAILRMQGYKVLASGDGVTALTLYKEHCEEIDLILTDLLMPGMSGMEMLQSMHAINQKLKVIVMSGYSELINEVSDCDFIGGRLAKPFGGNQLTREIRQPLAVAESEGESGSAATMRSA